MEPSNILKALRFRRVSCPKGFGSLESAESVATDGRRVLPGCLGAWILLRWLRISVGWRQGTAGKQQTLCCLCWPPNFWAPTLKAADPTCISGKHTSIFQRVLFKAKEWYMGTPYHRFSTLWKIQVPLYFPHVFCDDLFGMVSEWVSSRDPFTHSLKGGWKGALHFSGG